MMRNINTKARHTTAIYNLWLSWAWTLAAPSILIFVSYWVGPGWLPIFTFIFSGVLAAKARLTHADGVPSCTIAMFIMSRALFWSAIYMLAIAIIIMHEPFHFLLGEHNDKIPYIPALVFGPTVLIFSGYVWLRGDKLTFILEHRMRLGSPAEQGFLGRLYRQEGRFQVRYLFFLALFLSACAYAYYFLLYINVNANAPDKFVFIWIPLIFNTLSVAYMAVRYFTIWMYYDRDDQGGDVEFGNYTRLRYIIVDKSQFYLTEESGDPADFSRPLRLDTPASFSFQRREEFPLDKARQHFAEITKLDDFSIRFMYLSQTAAGESNTFHFIVGIPDPDALSNSPLKGRWFSLSQIDAFIRHGELDPILASEIHRLFTITMAWKTYDREGNRLYKIKNYKPTFRLRDIHNPKVDFNDSHWFRVAINNADKPFFRIKRFWTRVAHGGKG